MGEKSDEFRGLFFSPTLVLLKVVYSLESCCVRIICVDYESHYACFVSISFSKQYLDFLLLGTSRTL